MEFFRHQFLDILEKRRIAIIEQKKMLEKMHKEEEEEKKNREIQMARIKELDLKIGQNAEGFF